MKALTIESFGSASVMGIRDLPEPRPGKGEIRVRVRAAALNPVDWKIREGWLKEAFPHEFPITLGWDCAGVVDETGEGVTGFQAGDEVMAYCRKDVIRDGSLAEFILLEPRHLAKKPKELSFETAAAIPLAGLTAWQALFDAGKLAAGDCLLVHAAAGGVGHLAVQLAKQAGATVIGTASPGNHKFLRSIGVDHSLDYHDPDLSDQVRRVSSGGVDLILDCIGGPALEASPDFLAPGGRVVTIVDATRAESLRKKGCSADWIFVAPNSGQLSKLGDLAARGDLKVKIAAVHSMESYAEAFAALEAGHARGKRVLCIR